MRNYFYQKENSTMLNILYYSVHKKIFYTSEFDVKQIRTYKFKLKIPITISKKYILKHRKQYNT